MGYTVVQIGDLPGEGPGGAVRFLRRALGATAFGINHFTLPPGATGREPDESTTQQEAVMLVLAGSGELAVDGETLALEVGTAVRLDPEARRVPTAGPDGLVFVTVGSPQTDPYVARGPF